jgi:hypothetical protein
MRSLILPLLLMLILQGAGRAVAAESTPVSRITATVAKSPGWTGARTQAQRLQLLRRQALKYAAVSDLPSDRYQITALAGPIDLVRFFHLAATVADGGEDRRALLLHQWNKERAGTLEGDNPPPGVELFPDDLPSNALGALFGETLRDHNHDLTFDLSAALQQFLAPLEPVPDQTVGKSSFERLVHGLEANASESARAKSRAWATARPLYILPVVAPERAKTAPDADAALKLAGLEVRQLENHAVLIEKIGSPAPVPYVKAVVEEDAVTFTPVPLSKADEDTGPKADLIPKKPAPPSARIPRAVVVPEHPKAIPLKDPVAPGMPGAPKVPGMPKKVSPYPKAVPVR